MTQSKPATESTATRQGFSGSQVALIVLLAILITAALSVWLIRTYIIPKDFNTVELSSQEQVTLDGKLRILGINPADFLPSTTKRAPNGAVDGTGRLIPKKYEERAVDRDVRLSERELNAMVASNPDLARRFAIDLADDLASAKLLVPLDPDFPLMGGKTLRVAAGLELAYRDQHPVVKLRGISVMGVPLPNAWLGHLKNVDLVQEFGGDPGFWRSFSEGVQLIQVKDGALHIQLQE